MLPLRTIELNHVVILGLLQSLINLLRGRLLKQAISQQTGRNLGPNGITTKTKSEFYLSSLKNASVNASEFWKIIRSLENKHPVSLPPKICFDNYFITEESIICEAFNHHFISAGKVFNNQSNTLIAGSLSVSTTSNTGPSGNTFSFMPVNQGEVHINSNSSFRTSKKSKGGDNSDPSLPHLSADLISSPLTHIFNLSLASGKIPKVWKSAHVIPLLNGGDPSDLNNYRPISIPCLAKILESLVNSHSKSFLESSNILQSEQSGFRPDHSTTTAI